MNQELLLRHLEIFLGRIGVEELVHATPLLIASVTAAGALVHFPEPLQAVLFTWMKRWKLDDDSTVEEFQRALTKTYENRPVSAELRIGLAEIIRQLDREMSFGGESRARALVGACPPTRVVRAAPGPNTVPASPLAAFALSKTMKLGGQQHE